jgi:transposase
MPGLVAPAGCGLVIEDLGPDGLWEQVAPLLPAPKPRPYRHHGRRRADDRAALAGIVFVLRHGVGWRQVPQQALGVSGVTCWRRLREWTEAGVWPTLNTRALGYWSRCCAANSSRVVARCHAASRW